MFVFDQNSPRSVQRFPRVEVVGGVVPGSGPSPHDVPPPPPRWAQGAEGGRWRTLARLGRLLLLAPHQRDFLQQGQHVVSLLWK